MSQQKAVWAWRCSVTNAIQFSEYEYMLVMGIMIAKITKGVISVVEYISKSKVRRCGRDKNQVPSNDLLSRNIPSLPLSRQMDAEVSCGPAWQGQDSSSKGCLWQLPACAALLHGEQRHQCPAGGVQGMFRPPHLSLLCFSPVALDVGLS